jgi:hypothetical protein
MLQGRPTSNILLCISLSLVSGICTAADQNVPTTPRLELFERSQMLCRSLILGTPEIGNAVAGLIGRSGQSLGQLCECASIHAVSQTTDEVLKKIQSGDVESIDNFSRELQKGWSRCLK